MQEKVTTRQEAEQRVTPEGMFHKHSKSPIGVTLSRCSPHSWNENAKIIPNTLITCKNV